MNIKLFLIVSGLVAIIIFSGNQFNNIPYESIYSIADFSFVDDQKSGSQNCPYLQQKSETSCPYLNGSIEETSSSCPYLNEKTNCPYIYEKLDKEVCPYLNSKSEKHIKNSTS